MWPHQAGMGAPTRATTAMKMSELDDLRYAKGLLENPSVAARITNVVGSPIEKGLEFLPITWSDTVKGATEAALQTALRLAVATMDDSGPAPSRNILHKMVVTATGAGGGALGLPALAVELPISAVVMLRSIMDVARSEGERISLLETKLACIEVFALGGPSTADDASETGYLAVRTALSRAVTGAAQQIAENGLAETGGPAIARFITQVASRFGVVVSEKAAAQSIPIIGAVGGAGLNVIFLDHFQDIARGHFVVRRLERTHGPDEVRAEYENL